MNGQEEASHAPGRREEAGPSMIKSLDTTQQEDKDGEGLTDIIMESLTERPPSTGIHHPSHVLPPEVILETQLYPSNRNTGHVYKEIMASIGLDSPTPSQDIGRWDGNIVSPRVQHVSTSIRNSASSLVALGKHVLTPRQGRIWELRSRSPLGGQGYHEGGSLP